jgi:Cu2+-exporting ATPase
MTVDASHDRSLLGQGESPASTASEMLLRIDGMHCAGCVRGVENALAPLVQRTRVNLAAGTAEVRWDPSRTSPQQLIDAVTQAGFRASPALSAADSTDEQRDRRRLLLRLGVAGLCGMQVMMLAGTQYFTDAPPAPSLVMLLNYAQWALATPVLLYSGMPFFSGALAGLKQKQFSMDLPVSLALVLAYVASCINVVLGRGHVYFDSVTMFAFLLLLARWFEGRGRAQAQQRLRSLASVQPASASREAADGRLQNVSISQLRPNDTVVVAPGDAVPADGIILDSDASLDEALLTGEALPVSKVAGSAVYAGSVNAGNAPIRLSVTQTGAHTTLSQIQRLMLRSQSQKPRAQLLADRVAGYIVAGVLLTAAAGALWWWPQNPEMAFDVALAVLVVTCPCALSLATPIALAAASSQLATEGVLVANAGALLRLPAVDTVCFDKTGTLTTGRMRRVQQHTLGFINPERALQLAAALERGIRHPVASAFEDVVNPPRAQRIKVLPGRGVAGQICGGDFELTATSGPGDLTWVALRSADGELSRFGLAHTLRDGAAAAVSALRDDGLRTELISGDGAGAVSSTAEQLGIDRWQAAQKPDDKLTYLQSLQRSGKTVWMVGDGINDAPVLAAADVSASLANASSLAQARADLLLTRNELGGLQRSLETAKRTRRIVIENLAWAVAYNVIAVPLALSGAVTPWLAAAGMGLSSVTVTLNALRLLRSPRKASSTTGQGVTA